MLKQQMTDDSGQVLSQPPSGGCVLKHGEARAENDEFVQPPSGGCVLKLLVIVESMIRQSQPPSGGCVLKRFRSA